MGGTLSLLEVVHSGYEKVELTFFCEHPVHLSLAFEDCSKLLDVYIHRCFTWVIESVDGGLNMSHGVLVVAPLPNAIRVVSCCVLCPTTLRAAPAVSRSCSSSSPKQHKIHQTSDRTPLGCRCHHNRSARLPSQRTRSASTSTPKGQWLMRTN